MERKPAAARLNFDLAASQSAFAQNAIAFGVERLPIARSIFAAQDRQSIFSVEVVG
jgi:hypothetical protein